MNDYDYDAFMAFMKSLQQQAHYVNFVFHTPASPSADKIIEMMDELEVEVASRPCYNTVEELMNAVKEM